MTLPVLSRLGLGAVRFGQGRSRGARPPAFEAATILEVAARAGVTRLDLAPGAEDVVADGLSESAAFAVSIRADAQAVEACARLSLRRLGIERADALALPAAALTGDAGAGLWRRMRKLQDEGLFARLAIAAAPEEDPLGLVRRFKPEMMQLPLSLLDRRVVADGSLGEIAALGVDIQVHSVLMQGRLLAPAGGAPRRSEADARVSRARRLIAEAGADPLQAALAFALARPESPSVLVGVSSGAQLRAVIAAASAPAPVLDWDSLTPDLAKAAA